MVLFWQDLIESRASGWLSKRSTFRDGTWDIENVAGRVRGPGGKPPATRLLRVGVVEATEGR